MKLTAPILAHLKEFVQSLTESQTKPLGKFIHQMLLGIIASGSLILAEIGRSLEEEMALKHTEKRLSHHLNNPRWEITALRTAYLERISSKITPQTVIAVDLTDLSKPYAQKMEYLCRVRDEDKDEIGPGYWVLIIEAIRPDGKHIPLWLELFSSREEGFLSQNWIIFRAIAEVVRRIGRKGIWVFDRGFDDHKLIRFLEEQRLNWIIRQRGDRHVALGDRGISMTDLAARVPLSYQRAVERRKRGKTEVMISRYGSCAVRLKEKGRLLWLVIVAGLEKDEEGEEQKPMLLLTNLAAYGEGRSTKVLRYYLTRWGCEEGIRFLKEELDLEDLRALKLLGLKRLVWLAMLAYGLLCKLALVKRLVEWILKEAKAFGEAKFIYYRVRQVVGRRLQAVALGVGKPP